MGFSILILMNQDNTILIVTHDAGIENALHENILDNGFDEKKIFSFSRMGINPTIQPAVYEFFQRQRPQYVFLTSICAGGIAANQARPAEFIYQNLEGQNNIIYAAWKFGVKKLLYAAASCVYPRGCPQPMKEEYLLTGALEKTSEPYAVAKIAGLQLCQSFSRQYGFNTIALVPPTVYGPGVDASEQTAHVMGALIAKFTDAVQKGQNEVAVWGTGNPHREFLHVSDFAAACVFLMNRYDSPELINAGGGEDIPIKELAEMIARIVGFNGRIVYDPSQPDGAPRKLLDSRRIFKLGWRPKVSLSDGIEETCRWYRETIGNKTMSKSTLA